MASSFVLDELNLNFAAFPPILPLIFVVVNRTVASFAWTPRLVVGSIGRLTRPRQASLVVGSGAIRFSASAWDRCIVVTHVGRYLRFCVIN